jgi:acetylornithine deacetylase/succinyl-diaminopimelate desuccinylase-like protein
LPVPERATLREYRLAAVDVLPLLERLVSIDSVNPGLGGGGEAEIAAFVAEWADGAGLEVELDEAAPGRPNVITTARGTGGGRTLLLNAHTDTVGHGGMADPLVPRVQEGRLFGRGSYDMKGGLAACLAAAAEVARRGLRGNVVMTAVVDEEAASIGTQSMLQHVRADAAIVAEPTQMRVCVAHKGFVGFELETVGRAAHGSRPDLGVDAVAKMGHALVGLDALDRSLREHPTHTLLGSGSVHAGVIAGGAEYSTYPARCLLEGERRTVPGESLHQVEGELQGLLDGARRADPAFQGAWRVVAERRPFEVSEHDEIVRLVREYAGAGEVVGESYWTDAALIAESGVPAVVFGPGGEGAHADVEWVSIADVERCAAVLVSVASEFCA